MNVPDLQIKFFREQAKLSRAELSILTGIDIVLLTDYEQGRQTPTMENLRKIAAACQTSTDCIFGLSPDPIRQELF